MHDSLYEIGQNRCNIKIVGIQLISLSKFKLTLSQNQCFLLHDTYCQQQ